MLTLLSCRIFGWFNRKMNCKYMHPASQPASQPARAFVFNLGALISDLFWVFCNPICSQSPTQTYSIYIFIWGAEDKLLFGLELKIFQSILLVFSLLFYFFLNEIAKDSAEIDFRVWESLCGYMYVCLWVSLPRAYPESGLLKVWCHAHDDDHHHHHQVDYHTWDIIRPWLAHTHPLLRDDHRQPDNLQFQDIWAARQIKH